MSRRGLPSWLLATVAVAVVAIVVVAVVATRDGDGGGEACATPTAAPQSELALMPDGLSFDEIGTVTEVRKEESNTELEAVTTKPLDEVTVLIQDAVTAAGYRPAGMDNEGHEAEVFFTTGDLAAGQAKVEESGCDGRWEIELVLLDRNAG